MLPEVWLRLCYY